MFSQRTASEEDVGAECDLPKTPVIIIAGK